MIILINDTNRANRPVLFLSKIAFFYYKIYIFVIDIVGFCFLPSPNLIKAAV